MDINTHIAESNDKNELQEIIQSANDRLELINDYDTVEKEYVMVTFTVRVGEYEFDQKYFYRKEFVDSKNDVDLINEFYAIDLTDAHSDSEHHDRYWDSDRLIEVSRLNTFQATEKELDRWYNIGVDGDRFV